MANYSKSKKYHFTYKTTNLINNRYYLGMHSTNRLDDGYLGSGKRLYYEINKYGKDNFKFEILKYFDSREELIQAEVELITEEYLNDSNCLNLKPGGSGGFTLEQTRKGGKLSGAKHAKRMRNDLEFRQRIIQGVRQDRLKRIENGTFKTVFEEGHTIWVGKKHSQETIQKMKESHKGTGRGKTNSQYGTCWITNEKESKKIKKLDIIPEGWRLGRRLK